MLTRSQKLSKALTALRLAAERGRGDQCVSVRRWHLRVLIEEYDRRTQQVYDAEFRRLTGVEPPARDAFEALTDAVGAGMRRTNG